MPASPEKPPEERNLLLENIFGNYLVAQYQTSRLMEQFSKDLENKVPDAKGVKKLRSAHTFKFNGKWYQVVLTVKEAGLADILSKD